MSKPIPAEIMRHRTPGTEIKAVGSNFYIQRITCVWDKKTKKRRKKILEYIGKVTPEGIQPKTHKKVKVREVPQSKEFGASWAATQLSTDVKECLGKHFGQDAQWIYTTAILRCINPGAMRYIEHAYETSWLSESTPGLDVGSETLSKNMRRLGSMRETITAFMKEFIPAGEWHVIFDGTSMVCNSKNIREAQRGYNAKGGYDPQINLMYALALKNGGLAPVFYKRYPGCIPDVSAFRNMANAMGLATALVLGDKGLTSKRECERLSGAGLHYILPLRRNSTEYSRAALQKPGRTGFAGRFKHNGRIIWWHGEPLGEGATHACYLYLDEDLYHCETRSRAPGKLDRETPAKIQAAAQKQLEYGTFVLKTNLLSKTPEEIYRAYKTRGEIEQLFDLYKSESQFATTGMHSSETQEACLFLNHLSVMMAYRVYARLKENGWLKEYAVQKTLEHLLKDIRVTRYGDGGWQLEPVPKAARLALEAIGLTLPEAPG
jgi:transposase